MAVVDGVDAGRRATGRGATQLLLRMPDATAREQYEALRRLLAEAPVPVLISDRIDLALAAGAAGVNLPESGLGAADARALLGPERLVGRSVHSLEGVAAAASAGADFVILGPIFATPTHARGEGLGLALLAEAAAACPVPLLAIGGVNRVRAQQCIAAGAAGYAAIRLFQEEEGR